MSIRLDKQMNDQVKNDVAKVSAVTGFVERQSDVDNNRFVFAYTITIENISSLPFQLLSRHWLIKDANKKVEEV